MNRLLHCGYKHNGFLRLVPSLLTTSLSGHPHLLSSRLLSTGASPPTSLYNILGVNPHANQTEIKAAFYKLSKVYHPDLNTDPEMRLRFIEVSEAYEILGNARLRRHYDRGLLVPKSGAIHGAQMEEVFNPFATKDGSSDHRVPTVKRPEHDVYSYMGTFDEFYDRSTQDHFGKIKSTRKMGSEIRSMSQELDRKNGMTRGAAICFGAILTLSIGGLAFNYLRV